MNNAPRPDQHQALTEALDKLAEQAVPLILEAHQERGPEAGAEAAARIVAGFGSHLVGNELCTEGEAAALGGLFKARIQELMSRPVLH
jgi:hypothetical protein